MATLDDEQSFHLLSTRQASTEPAARTGPSRPIQKRRRRSTNSIDKECVKIIRERYPDCRFPRMHTDYGRLLREKHAENERFPAIPKQPEWKPDPPKARKVVAPPPPTPKPTVPLLVAWIVGNEVRVQEADRVDPEQVSYVAVWSEKLQALVRPVGSPFEQARIVSWAQAMEGKRCVA